MELWLQLRAAVNTFNHMDFVDTTFVGSTEEIREELAKREICEGMTLKESATAMTQQRVQMLKKSMSPKKRAVVNGHCVRHEHSIEAKLETDWADKENRLSMLMRFMDGIPFNPKQDDKSWFDVPWASARLRKTASARLEGMDSASIQELLYQLLTLGVVHGWLECKPHSTLKGEAVYRRITSIIDRPCVDTIESRQERTHAAMRVLPMVRDGETWSESISFGKNGIQWIRAKMFCEPGIKTDPRWEKANFTFWQTTGQLEANSVKRTQEKGEEPKDNTIFVFTLAPIADTLSDNDIEKLTEFFSKFVNNTAAHQCWYRVHFDRKAVRAWKKHWGSSFLATLWKDLRYAATLDDTLKRDHSFVFARAPIN